MSSSSSRVTDMSSRQQIKVTGTANSAKSGHFGLSS